MLANICMSFVVDLWYNLLCMFYWFQYKQHHWISMYKCTSVRTTLLYVVIHNKMFDKQRYRKNWKNCIVKESIKMLKDLWIRCLYMGFSFSFFVFVYTHTNSLHCRHFISLNNFIFSENILTIDKNLTMMCVLWVFILKKKLLLRLYRLILKDMSTILTSLFDRIF